MAAEPPDLYAASIFLLILEMANNFTAIYLHLIFAAKFREARITEAVEKHLYPFVSGVINNRKNTMVEIGGAADHMHILVRLHPTQTISDLVRDIKANSSKLLNETNILKRRFEWQRGFGAVSCSPGHVDEVRRYIANQKEHHRKLSFGEEFKSFWERNKIEYVEEFGFEELH